DGVKDRSDSVGVVAYPASAGRRVDTEDLEREDPHVPGDAGDTLAVVPDRAEDTGHVRPVVVVGLAAAGLRGVVDHIGAVAEVVGVGSVDVRGQVRVAGVDARVDDRHRDAGRAGLDTPGAPRRDVV